MTTLQGALRAVGLLMVAAGIVDPGCAESRRPRIEVALVGDLPAPVRAQTLARVAEAAPWASVSEPPGDEKGAPTEAPVAVRLVAGDPAPVMRALDTRPAALALQVEAPALALASIAMPARVVAGTRVEIAVSLDGVPQARGVIRVVVRDAVSGAAQGQAEVEAVSASDGHVDVLVPWLATRDGAMRVRVEASGDGIPGLRPAPPGEVSVDVQSAGAEVAVFEARPTWAARFARLALAGVEGVGLRSDVRVAPGVAVRSAGGDAASSGMGAPDAAVVLVGGVEALSAGDVDRLERAARDRGRAVVLLLDDEPGGGPWRRLWPGGVGRARRVSRPVTALVAGHRWKLREWLSPAVSTEAVPLAYLDSEPTPVVMGRALGAGRIVLVTALDAWRWRADEGVAFALGWRALVLRLAGEVPPPVETTTWLAGRGRARTLHVEVAVRQDQDASGGVRTTAVVGRGARLSVPVVPVGRGRWRGAVRGPATPALQGVEAEVRAAGRVVGRAAGVIDVRAPAPAASWHDVEQHQAERGALAAGPQALAATIAGLRARLAVTPPGRWYVTRRWEFAAVALTVLGAEWVLRRRQGNR